MYRRLALAGARLGVLLERALTHGAAARTVRDGASGLLPASWSWD